MKFLVVFDLADQSTREVGVGMCGGLTFLGHEVKAVHLNQHIDFLLRPYGDMPQDMIPVQARKAIFGVLNDLILGAMARLRPDVLLVISGWGVSPYTIDILRQSWPTKTVIYLTESPYLNDEQKELIGAYDLVLNNDLENMDELKTLHDAVEYMPHSYNPEIHAPVAGAGDPCIDVFMCATGFTERVKLLEGVNWDGINLCLTGLWMDTEKSSLCEYIYPHMMANKDLPRLYSQAKINVNAHRTSRVWRQGGDGQEHVEMASSLGPRCFEILACGGFLLTDYRSEADSFLVDGRDYVTYSDAEDLEEKIRFYLRHEGDRQEIARNGMNAVKGCTFGGRTAEILIPRLEVI